MTGIELAAQIGIPAVGNQMSLRASTDNPRFAAVVRHFWGMARRGGIREGQLGGTGTLCKGDQPPRSGNIVAGGQERATRQSFEALSLIQAACGEGTAGSSGALRWRRGECSNSLPVVAQRRTWGRYVLAVAHGALPVPELPASLLP